MPDERAPDHGAEVRRVRVTLTAVSGSGRRPLAERARRPRLALALAAVVLVAAVAGVSLLGSPGSRRVQSAAGPLTAASPAPVAASAQRTEFGIGLRCTRLVVVAPGGGFARVDVDRFSPCGAYGNYVTIVLERVRGVWVRELEMRVSGLSCRAVALSPVVLRELRLCSLRARAARS